MPDDYKDLIETALGIYEERRRRTNHFKGARLYEPSWDLMLFLFINQARHVTVTEACFGTAAPRTTGLRHIEEMKRLGYVEYQKVSHDRRVYHVVLSASAKLSMRTYLAGYS